MPSPATAAGWGSPPSNRVNFAATQVIVEHEISVFNMYGESVTHKQVIPDRYIDRQRLLEKLHALFPPPANDVKLQVSYSCSLPVPHLTCAPVEAQQMDHHWCTT